MGKHESSADIAPSDSRGHYQRHRSTEPSECLTPLALPHSALSVNEQHTKLIRRTEEGQGYQHYKCEGQ